MTRSRELAALLRLERRASNPAAFVRRSTIAVIAIVVLGGPLLSIADHALQRSHLELLKWIYLGVGAILAMGAQALAAGINASRDCRYLDMAAVRRRIAVLQGETATDHVGRRRQ